MRQQMLIPTLTVEQEQNFGLWWKAWPKKVAKFDAMRAWVETERHHPPIEQMVALLAQQKQTDQWLESGGAYIPHASTYLRRGQFLDELEVELGPNVNGKAWHETWSGTVAKGAEFGLSPSQFAHPSEFVAAVMRKANQKLERVA